MPTRFKEKLQHKIPIEQSDIRYALVNTKDYRPNSLRQADYDHAYNDIVLAAKNEVRAKYKTQFFDDTTHPDNQEKIHYYLFGLVDPLKIDDALIHHLQAAKNTPNSRVNMAMIFDEDNAQRAAEIIVALDKQLGVNTIYQDTLIEYDGKKYVTISAIDAADNMVCETFRVKYKTIRRTDAASVQKLQEARQEAWQDVKTTQAIYTTYHLWQRSPYDGTCMFRTRHGWLTTATRTLKNNIHPQDLSLILQFEEKSETITYAGDRLPSSDLPEFLVLVARNEQVLAQQGEVTPVTRYVAHFHKNEITRNPLFAHYAIPFSRYGVSESGHAFADELFINNKARDGIDTNGKSRGFIILEHGLVHMGVQLEHFEDFLQKFKSTT